MKLHNNISINLKNHTIELMGLFQTTRFIQHSPYKIVLKKTSDVVAP